MRIHDPLIELLAIKLYEHDHLNGRWPPKDGLDNWASVENSIRELYRDIARGNEVFLSAEEENEILEKAAQ